MANTVLQPLRSFEGQSCSKRASDIGLRRNGETTYSNLPQHRDKVGSTKRFRAVEVTKPPRIASAIGSSISRPGSPLPIARGSRPRPCNQCERYLAGSTELTC